MPQRPRPLECPHCGAEYAAGRLACPECGSDAETGWKSAEEIDYESVEIPDGLPADFGEDPARHRTLVVALVVLVVFGVVVLLSR